MRRPIFAVAAALSVLAACGSNEPTSNDASAADTPAPGTVTPGDTTSPGDTNPSTPSTPPAGSTAAGTEVPEILRFSAPLVGGGTFDAATVAGTPTVFWFWAPG